MTSLSNIRAEAHNGSEKPVKIFSSQMPDNYFEYIIGQ